MSFAPNSLRLANADINVVACSPCRINKYREVAEKSIRNYLEYFATNKPISPETENIDRLVKW